MYGWYIYTKDLVAKLQQNKGLRARRKLRKILKLMRHVRHQCRFFGIGHDKPPGIASDRVKGGCAARLDP